MHTFRKWSFRHPAPYILKSDTLEHRIRIERKWLLEMKCFWKICIRSLSRHSIFSRNFQSQVAHKIILLRIKFEVCTFRELEKLTRRKVIKDICQLHDKSSLAQNTSFGRQVQICQLKCAHYIETEEKSRKKKKREGEEREKETLENTS